MFKLLMPLSGHRSFWWYLNKKKKKKRDEVGRPLDRRGAIWTFFCLTAHDVGTTINPKGRLFRARSCHCQWSQPTTRSIVSIPDDVIDIRDVQDPGGCDFTRKIRTRRYELGLHATSSTVRSVWIAVLQRTIGNHIGLRHDSCWWPSSYFNASGCNLSFDDIGETLDGDNGKYVVVARTRVHCTQKIEWCMRSVSSASILVTERYCMTAIFTLCFYKNINSVFLIRYTALTGNGLVPYQTRTWTRRVSYLMPLCLCSKWHRFGCFRTEIQGGKVPQEGNEIQPPDMRASVYPWSIPRHGYLWKQKS